MWALERHDWGSLRALRSAREIPEAIASLLAASSEEGARQAYWRIDNSVVVQGVLYQAALPTLECLLTGLLRASSHARPCVLELILQIAAGTPAQSECNLGNAMLAEQCRR